MSHFIHRIICISYQQCGCVSPTMWNTRYVILPETNTIILASLCNITNSCYFQATTAVLSSKSLMSEYCSSCTQECMITQFTIQTSAMKAPPEWQMESIKGFVENSSVPIPTNWLTEWRDVIADNYVGLMVVSEALVVETNTQSATYSIIDVLSNVGGQAGLWIGVSFLALLELIEMGYRLFRHEFHMIRERFKKRNKS